MPERMPGERRFPGKPGKRQVRGKAVVVVEHFWTKAFSRAAWFCCNCLKDVYCKNFNCFESSRLKDSAPALSNMEASDTMKYVQIKSL